MCRSSGEIGPLLAKPANWEKVYCIGFRNSSYGDDGKNPAKAQEFLDRFTGKVKLDDTLLWWVTNAYDSVVLFADAIKNAGPSSAEIIGYLDSLKNHQGYFGNYTFSATEHNGLDVKSIVMSVANSGKNGMFKMAPGYS
jgi:branched-chain amino acid transport system substrate-binding protein